MDPLTQGLLGAAAAQVCTNKNSTKVATIAGFLAGMAADLDVLISSTTDHLLAIEYHRHFTHALLFIPLGSLICAIALYPLMRRQTTFLTLYLWTTLGYATHGLLDACTSYGTSLLIPFSDQRVSWSIMSIIDPIFTLALLISVSGTFFTRRWSVAALGAAFACSYFGYGISQHHLAKELQAQLITSRGHIASQAIIKPTIGNLLLWRSIYQHDDYFFVDAVRVSPFSAPIVYAGDSIKILDLRSDLPWLSSDSTTNNDIKRFAHFSQGFIALDKENRDQIIDVRYGILPNSLSPLWAIKVDPKDENLHTPFVTFRRSLKETRDQFFTMLRGRAHSRPN